MAHRNKVNLTSANLTEEKLAELRRILPEAFSEDKIDWEKLRTVLGDEIDSHIEKFNFSWAGKSTAIKNVLIPSIATLRPVKDESVKFDESENLFIEGDNLEVLKLLQKAYFEKVKMIYIDPPYNTGGDFVYHDDFAAPVKNYLQQTGQVDAEGNKLETNKETNGRYHSDWLSMMYPRLKLAWNLLKDDGVIFVSIDDKEVHRLRMLMDEIFGEENAVAQFIWQRRQNADSRNQNNVSVDHEYVLTYSKNKTSTIFEGVSIDFSKYTNPDNDSRGAWASIDLSGLATRDQRPNLHYDVVDPSTGIAYPPNPKRGWSKSKSVVQQMIQEGRILFPKNPTGRPREKKFLADLQKHITGFSSNLDSDLVGYTSTGTRQLTELLGDKFFDFPKPIELIQLFIKQATENQDIILDFFAGSGTTAHSVMAQNAEDGGNRKWIAVQLPEKIAVENAAYKAGYKTIADIAKERIRRAAKMIEDEVGEKRGTHNGLREVYGYKEGQIKELQSEETGYRFDFDDGFKVFKLTESNYPENNFEFDPAKSDMENKEAFELYLGKAKQTKLFDVDKTIDVVYENIVKEGFSLNSKITESKVGKNKVHTVIDGEQQFLVCLDKRIDGMAVSELTNKAYKGKLFICLDNALDDTAKANLGLNVELKTI